MNVTSGGVLIITPTIAAAMLKRSGVLDRANKYMKFPKAKRKKMNRAKTIERLNKCIDQLDGIAKTITVYEELVRIRDALQTTPDGFRLTRTQFPTMLRKMWSGGEVQQWLDENSIPELD